MSYYLALSILSSSSRREERRKLLSAEARRMLSLLEGSPIEENDLAREALGRPFFSGGGPDFSIAHSGALAAVSHARGGRTGCDIEMIRPRPGAREIAKDFFSAAEQNYLFSGGGFDEARFYQIWTLKECFLKLRGLSVFDMAASPSFIRDDGKGREQAKTEVLQEPQISCQFAFTEAVSSPLSFYLYELSGGDGQCYMLATAIEGTEQQRPQIQWFSQVSLACKMIAEIKAAVCLRPPY